MFPSLSNGKLSRCLFVFLGLVCCFFQNKSDAKCVKQSNEPVNSVEDLVKHQLGRARLSQREGETLGEQVEETWFDALVGGMQLLRFSSLSAPPVHDTSENEEH